MSLEIPELDDRTFEELVMDARKRIPVHAEAWTDHNHHDPGVTILELFAWIAESDIYELDQVTDAHVEKYLKLLGVRPARPTSASAWLSLSPPDGEPATRIPAGERLAVEDVTGEVYTFETERSVQTTRARISAVVSNHRRGRTDNSTANETDGMYFLAFGERAARRSAMYIGFDGDPFGAADVLDLRVDFHEANLPDPATHGEEDGASAVEFDPSVRVAWQYCTDYEEWYRERSWKDLTVLCDETNQLYGGGTVRLERPSDWSTEEAAILDQRRPRQWIRCTVEKPGFEIPPQLDSIRTNAVPVRHRTGETGAVLEHVDGGSETTALPDQTFAFEHAPVLDASITVDGEPWTAVTDFDASGSADRHYVLDSEHGMVHFGDETRGKIPDPGQQVVAGWYVHGGGSAGNVSADAAWHFEADEFADIDVAAPSGATGGCDAETLEAALSGHARDRETPYRAVTAEDFEYVATHTPGLRFGRAAAIVERETHDGDCADSKSVRVVTVPFSTRERAIPSEGFLDAVQCHLQRHRLLTDRVAAEPPLYVGVEVIAEVELDPGRSAAERAAAVEDALHAFIDPLEGFDGDGWPFGRPLYRSELYETIERVDGVDCVYDLSITIDGDADIDADGNALIPETALLYSSGHTVDIRRDRTGCARRS
jgi:predicted phage baseplate assembly protein